MIRQFKSLFSKDVKLNMHVILKKKEEQFTQMQMDNIGEDRLKLNTKIDDG